MNFLSCTFANCEGGLYHQDCLYAFLRANKLEKVSAAVRTAAAGLLASGP